MSKGNPNISEAGKATQFPHNDPTKGGRPLSFKNQFKSILSENNGFIWVNASDVQKRDHKGVEQLGFNIGNIDALLVRLQKIARGKNDRTALDAIKFLWEQIDGKAVIKADHTTDGKPIGVVIISDD